jgi:flagellar P-ring protein precursor FlgI
MRLLHRQLWIVVLLALAGGAALAQSTRVKDIATVEGVRPNQLIGYGLVVGLDGTGDSQQTKFTTQSVANMLETYGVSIPADKIKLKNVAAVMVTATLPAFARPGTGIDTEISSLGDARSLQGGTLLQTPLRAANGEVYAVAQGSVSIGGFSAESGGSSASKNHPTVGRIPGGAIVEKETKTDITQGDVIRLTLHNSDFTTATRVATAIDCVLGSHYARALDAQVVSVDVPDKYKGATVELVALIESATVTTDSVAKVIVNERTGTVIIGGQCRISPVAVSHGALTVEVNTTYNVSQPQPKSGGQTAVTAQPDVKVHEEPASLVSLDAGSTIGELVRALNVLRVTPRDLIAILQALKQAGALQAELEIM